MPLPEHSSSTTDSIVSGAFGVSPSARRPFTAPRMAARPHFMSAAPRPTIHSPSRSAPNGPAPPHCDSGSGLTTSMWPLRMSDRPEA